MTYLSIMEKLNILFDTMMDFYFIIVFSVFLMVFTFMYIAKKITIKKYVLLMILSFMVVFGISIITNYEVLSNTFDNFATIFFGNIYFPSIYVYIGTLVISFIAFIVSIFNIMLNKIYKVVNSVMFVVNNVLFVVILNIIAKNKIDVFSTQSLYSNTNLVAVLELSMGLFILWVLSLITIYITNTLVMIVGKKRTINSEDKNKVYNPIIEISDDVINNINSLNDKVLENTSLESISKAEVVEVKSANETIEENTIINNSIKEDVSSITFNDILNATIPVTYYDSNYINNEYTLSNPQIVYEDNYNKVKSATTFNDILVETNEINDEVLPVEDLTKIEKKKVSDERLVTNTISLIDLIDMESDSTEIFEQCKNITENSDYSVDDYKKFMKMLTEIKNYSNGTNINIDDAVAIGLINNYSVDDCMMLKNILENNLN